MSGFARKVKRNQIKEALKKQGDKREFTLSKYRYKTQDEILKEQTDKIVESMAKSMARHS